MRIVDVANIFAEISGGEVKIIGAFESEKLSEAMVLGYDSADSPFASIDKVRTILMDEGLLPSKE